MTRDTKVEEFLEPQEQLQGTASILPGTQGAVESGGLSKHSDAPLPAGSLPPASVASGIWQHCEPLKYLTACGVLQTALHRYSLPPRPLPAKHSQAEQVPQNVLAHLWPRMPSEPSISCQ